MKTLMYNLYKFFDKKINNKESLVDICFLRMNNDNVKSEHICRICFTRETGIRLYEFKYNPYCLNAYVLSFDHDKLLDDYLSECNFMNLVKVTDNKKYSAKDFKLESNSIRKGGKIVKLSNSVKERFQNYLNVIDSSVKDEEDLFIIKETISKSINPFGLAERRNGGTLLYMFDPVKYSFMLAREDNLVPVVQLFRQVKVDKSPLLVADLKDYKKCDFLYHITSRFYKNKEKTYLFIALSDEDSNKFFKDIKIYEVNNDISNLDFIVQSVMFNFFEEYGYPEYIYYDEHILCPHLIKFKHYNINVTDVFNKFKVSLLGHVSQLLTNYLNHVGKYEYNQYLDELNYVCNFLKYCLDNEFDPVTNIFADNGDDLYMIIRDYISLQNSDFDLDDDMSEELDTTDTTLVS